MVNTKEKIEALEQIISEYELRLNVLKQELRELKLKELTDRGVPITWATTDTNNY
jgi:DNA gyrase/topoisomerase IV subunit A